MAEPWQTNHFAFTKALQHRQTILVTQACPFRDLPLHGRPGGRLFRCRALVRGTRDKSIRARGRADIQTSTMCGKHVVNFLIVVHKTVLTTIKTTLGLVNPRNRGGYTKCLNLTSRRRHAHQRVVLGVNNTMAHSLHHVHARTHAKSTNLGPNFFYENRHGTCMHRSDRREPSKRRPVTPPGGSSGSLAAYASQPPHSPPHRPPSAAFRGRSRL